MSETEPTAVTHGEFWTILNSNTNATIQSWPNKIEIHGPNGNRVVVHRNDLEAFIAALMTCKRGNDNE